MPLLNQKLTMPLIEHELCDKPTCIICTNVPAPILCDEVEYTIVLKTRQREKDIGKIVTFFTDRCSDDILDTEKLDAMDTKCFLWELAHAVFHCADKNSKGYTWHVHKLSRDFPQDAIVVELFMAAVHYKIVDNYKQFLELQQLTHFLPTDMESLD